MVNNSGIGGTENHEMVHEMTEDTWDAVVAIDINTSSVMGIVGQAVYGGKPDKSSEVAHIADTVIISGVLRIERSSDGSYEADCGGIRKAQNSL